MVLAVVEHLALACVALLDELVRTCLRLRVLTTSHQPLHVAGETTWRVPSLTLLDSHAASCTDELAWYEAVRLFTGRSRSVVLASQPGAGSYLAAIIQLDR